MLSLQDMLSYGVTLVKDNTHNFEDGDQKHKQQKGGGVRQSL